MAERPAEDTIVFALDIGTRSVIGIVGAREDGLLRVLAVESEEYRNRAVVDGQIEDIEETAKVAAIVKKRLEEKLGFSLKSVSIAAAGRVLRTQRASFDLEMDGNAADAVFVAKLESGAVRSAYDSLFQDGEEKEGTDFFCVGHSVIQYALDGYKMSTILGHTGKKACVEVIATFLPREVVESLYATMRSVGLTVASLTLEPIAAMNAVIPADIRKLNLALVDIGAGTSDIALCNNGGVSAYTMATVAGDEVTETIMREYLVDFATAEEMKRLWASGQAAIAYENILGMRYEETADAFSEKLQPVLDELCSVICERILEVNGSAPAAVFLTGGGSRLQPLCKLVAGKLSIDENRVAVGGNNYLKRMITSDCEISGPEYATPVGIALTAAERNGGDTFSVTVNGEKLHLVGSWDMTILDSLLLAGYRYSQLMGHVGKSIQFELDGERRTVRGGLPGQAQILLNGDTAALSTPVSPGDSIEFQEAKHGEDAAPMLSEVADSLETFPVTFNGAELFGGSFVTVNGRRMEQDTVVKNGDIIVTSRVDSVRALCREMDLEPLSCDITVNGEPTKPDKKLKSGDMVLAIPRHGKPPVDLPPAPEPAAPPAEKPSGNPAPAAAPALTPQPKEPVPAGAIQVMLNGQSTPLRRRPDGAPHQFVDLFNYVDIDPHKPQGNIVLRLNGQDASYLDLIRDGDRVDIYWDGEKRS